MLTFNKGEHLTGKKNFEEIVSKGVSFYVFPFRVLLLFKDALSESQNPLHAGTQFCARIGISVPKRKFSSANDRNTIKRQVREAYRKNKDMLLYPSLRKKGVVVNLLFIYAHNQILESSAMEHKIKVILKKTDHEHIALL